LHSPASGDSHGIPSLVWKEIGGQECELPANKPLAVVAYESVLPVQAFVEPMAVGDALIDMPLFLEPDKYVPVPLEATYQTAFDAVPKRWRTVLQP
jgi:hypothetical protein